MARHNDDYCAPYQFEVAGFQTWKPDVDNTAHKFSLHFTFRENVTTVVTECNLNDTTHPEPGPRPDNERRFVCENPNVHFMWEDAGPGALTVIEQACPKQNGEPSGFEVSGTTRPEVECFATEPSFALGAGTYCLSKTQYLLVNVTG
ncbi:hypothetical protein B0T18DRAFT_446750 [Schizothecium vesticola]|uniref:AA1-like domain-containing protein n=1 Tax=Schizothecium vesticola TaxID=314040 RepID=A0AA40EVE5_9PEZI|nr:hypothetical protein B0T18DRAFT_446750 [Schizothecium vesticola]